jgi:hypothetical protein
MIEQTPTGHTISPGEHTAPSLAIATGDASTMSPASCSGRQAMQPSCGA